MIDMRGWASIGRVSASARGHHRIANGACVLCGQAERNVMRPCHRPHDWAMGPGRCRDCGAMPYASGPCPGYRAGP